MVNQSGAQRAAPAPWTPFGVSVIALLLPLGAAIVTVRNLYRLGEIDARLARHLTVAMVAILALGLCALLGLAANAPNARQTVSSGVNVILSVGVAFASYVSQSRPFASWRREHRGERTSPWIAGLGTAALFELLTILVAVPLYALAAALLGLRTPGGAP